VPASRLQLEQRPQLFVTERKQLQPLQQRITLSISGIVHTEPKTTLTSNTKFVNSNVNHSVPVKNQILKLFDSLVFFCIFFYHVLFSISFKLLLLLLLLLLFTWMFSISTKCCY